MALLFNCVIGCAAVAAAALSSDSDDWQPIGLFVTLAVFAVASEVLATRLGQTPDLDGNLTGFHFTSSAPPVLGVVLLGAAPTLAFALLALAIGALIERPQWRDLIANGANYAVHLTTAAFLAGLAISDWSLSAGDPLLVPVVTGIFAYVLASSLALFAIYTVLVEGDSVRDLLRAVWRVQLPVEAPIILLTGLTAHIYGTAGLVGLAGLAAVQLIYLLLARQLHRSNERGLALIAQAEQVSELSASRSQLVEQILSAEERERRRLAAALHDDAMQNLLAARQDLSDAQTGPELVRARMAIEATIDQLRDAIFELHPAVLEQVGLAAAVEAVADRAARHGGFDVTVEVDAHADPHGDTLVFSISRELLANVAAHAGATRARIRIRETHDSIAVEVSDDGCGFTPNRLRTALAQGHIGLASTAERVEALGGTFSIDSQAGRGTTVTLSLPRLADSQVRGESLAEVDA